MIWILSGVMAIQALAMMADEFYFHRKRGLPRWERIGHPIDTATFLGAAAWTRLAPLTSQALAVFAILAGISCLMITKDEWVHAKLCTPAEHWIHSVLFVVHPLVLISWYFSWARFPGLDVDPANQMLFQGFLSAQFSLVALFFIFQILYWNFLWKQPQSTHP